MAIYVHLVCLKRSSKLQGSFSLHINFLLRLPGSNEFEHNLLHTFTVYTVVLTFLL